MDPIRRERNRSGGRRLALAVLYWAAVLAVSLALVVALIMFIESRDPASLGG